MADYAHERSIGQRIKAARKARGIRSIREFSEVLQGTGLTESVLENIEAGRKVDLPISDLLNIAYALKVPPSLLLSPLADSSQSIDLPNLSDGVRAMSLAEFDAWVSGHAGGSFRASSAAERSDIAELEAFRELRRTQRDLEREQVVGELEGDRGHRVEYLERQIAELTDFLHSAGWVV